jgi:hypothetical protein
VHTSFCRALPTLLPVAAATVSRMAAHGMSTYRRSRLSEWVATLQRPTPVLGRVPHAWGVAAVKLPTIETSRCALMWDRITDEDHVNRLAFGCI